MIVALHVATGAAGGALVRSRKAAVPLGLLVHLAGDLMPHEDNPSVRFEEVSGVAGILLLAVTRGIADAAVVGALAGSAPDVEHVYRLPRPGGRKLFPSHRFHGWHRRGGVRVWAQLVAAGLILGALARR